MPLKEKEDAEAAVRDGDLSRARAALERAVKPILPETAPREALGERLGADADTVIMTCGNPFLMADIQAIAGANHIRFEKEDW